MKFWCFATDDHTVSSPVWIQAIEDVILVFGYHHTLFDFVHLLAEPSNLSIELESVCELLAAAWSVRAAVVALTLDMFPNTSRPIYHHSIHLISKETGEVDLVEVAFP